MMTMIAWSSWYPDQHDMMEKKYFLLKNLIFLNFSKTFQNLPKPSQTLQNPPKPPKTPKNRPKRPKIAKNRGDENFGRRNVKTPKSRETHPRKVWGRTELVSGGKRPLEVFVGINNNHHNNPGWGPEWAEKDFSGSMLDRPGSKVNDTVAKSP